MICIVNQIWTDYSRKSANDSPYIHVQFDITADLHNKEYLIGRIFRTENIGVVCCIVIKSKQQRVACSPPDEIFT